MRTRQNNRTWLMWLFVFIIIVVLLWILIGLDGLQKISTSIFPGYYKKQSERRELRKSKEALVRENLDLKGQVSFLSSNVSVLEEEIRVLNDLVDMDDHWSGYPYFEGIPARIIFKDPNGVFNSFLVDKGSDDGVTRNMPVLGMYGVIGRVIDVKPKYCRIRTIKSPKLSLGVVVERTKELGLITGGRKDLSLSYISINSSIALEDRILTSGTTDITPAGLYVGKVKEVVRREPEQDIIVKVESQEDLSQLFSVWILKSVRVIPEPETVEEVLTGAD